MNKNKLTSGNPLETQERHTKSKVGLFSFMCILLSYSRQPVLSYFISISHNVFI